MASTGDLNSYLHIWDIWGHGIIKSDYICPINRGVYYNGYGMVTIFWAFTACRPFGAGGGGGALDPAINHRASIYRPYGTKKPEVNSHPKCSSSKLMAHDETVNLLMCCLEARAFSWYYARLLCTYLAGQVSLLAGQSSPLSPG